MEFSNGIVGGSDELVRDGIQSRGFVSGSTGWRINRDGSAEFNDVTVRGAFQIGSSPSPPNPYITGEILSGTPTIAIYDGVHSVPARIQGYDLGGYGGLVLDTGAATTEEAALALGGNLAELIYEEKNAPFTDALVKLGPPFNEALKMRVTSASSQDLEFGFDALNPTPDLTDGRMYTFGEILMNQLAPDNNYASRAVDGKGPQTVTGTTIGTTDTNCGACNIVNVYMEDGWMYRAIIHVDMRNANVGGRLDFKLWDGTVGSGTQLGGTNRRWTDNSGAGASNGGTVLIFMWRQVGTGTSANLNLSAAKTVVTAAAATVEANAAYVAVIEKMGDANKIGSL